MNQRESGGKRKEHGHHAGEKKAVVKTATAAASRLGAAPAMTPESALVLLTLCGRRGTVVYRPSLCPWSLCDVGSRQGMDDRVCTDGGGRLAGAVSRRQSPGKELLSVRPALRLDPAAL